MFSLSNILKINAISSGLTGLQLVIFSNFAAGLFAVDTQVPFRITGIFLIVFALFVIHQAYQKPIRPKQVVHIIWIDRLWVLANVLSVPLLYNTISVTGLVLIVAIAAWVALMAYAQNYKLIRL
jgi:hypothetical protein